MTSNAPTKRAAITLCLLLIAGCQIVLGLEDHQLGSPDGNPGGQGGAEAGNGGVQAGAGNSNSGGTQSKSTGGTSQSAGGIGGRSDSKTATGVECDSCELQKALIHRYSFEGSGKQIINSVGSAHGTAIGTTQSGQGSVVLSGSGEYIDLPNGIVSALTNATFEAWIRWRGGEPWQRIFDFGNSSSSTEGVQGVGVTYLLLTPAADSSSGSPRAIFSRGGTKNETRLSASDNLPRNATVHIALVLDATGKTFTLFMNGSKHVSATLTYSLSELTDINNWLGHSQFESDADFDGTFYEFRIYGAALSTAQVRLSYDLGPDAVL